MVWTERKFFFCNIFYYRKKSDSSANILILQAKNCSSANTFNIMQKSNYFPITSFNFCISVLNGNINLAFGPTGNWVGWMLT